MAEELRFIQIATSVVSRSNEGPVTLYVFGLTSDGRVYQLEERGRGWHAVGMTNLSAPAAG
jgi:hypothetical protein